MSTQPLLPTHRTLSKGKGKARAPSPSSSGSSTPPPRGFRAFDEDEPEEDEERGRCVTIRFTGDQGGDLDVWVEEGESVGSVKEKVSSWLSDSEDGLWWRCLREKQWFDGEDANAKARTAFAFG
jgi:hypothetical protein